jgi:hypothetical protein
MFWLFILAMKHSSKGFATNGQCRLGEEAIRLFKSLFGSRVFFITVSRQKCRFQDSRTVRPDSLSFLLSVEREIPRDLADFVRLL